MIKLGTSFLLSHYKINEKIRNMRSLTVFIITMLFLFNANAFGQISLQPGGHYLQGIAVKKVVVSYEDHTVWAITQSGQVYIKRDAEPDFSIYSPMVGEMVDDLTGYSETEMYFLIQPKKLIQIKNHIKTTLVFPGTVSNIRGIAVLLDATKTPQSFGNPAFFKDKLAIATDEYLYVILKGETIPSKFDIYGQPSYDIKDFSITRSSIKDVEFKGKFSTSGRCSIWESDYSIIKQKSQTTFLSVIPDKGAYSDIRCSLFYHGSVWSSDYAFDLWGTAQGLYVKKFGACPETNPVKTVISGETVNYLDAVYQLSALDRNVFVLAATDNGLYYTPKRIYDNIYISDVNKVSFQAFAPLTGIKINNLTTDFTEFTPYFFNSYPDYIACEKVIWLATSQGVKKLYALFEGGEFQDKQLTNNFLYSKTPDLQNENEVRFNLCIGQDVEINSGIQDNLLSQLLIQWYKDDVEMPELVGKTKVTFTETGKYKAQITTLCEGVRMKSKNFTIQQSSAAEITFNYPAVINLCEGQSKVLQTVSKTNYTYKWFKDGSELRGQTKANYSVTETGKYKVAVSNCTGVYTSSSEVQINVLNITKPQITANRLVYCEGDVPKLSINNAAGYKAKWYFNGVEKTGFADQNEIEAIAEGNYKALLLNDLSCEKASDNFTLKINAKPVIVVSKQPDRLLCYGESASLSVSSAPNYTYAWSNGATTPSIQVVNSGTFSVIVTNENGCSSLSVATAVIVNAKINLSIPPESKICTFTGEELTLVADQGYQSYTWNGVKTTTNSFKVSVPGTYIVEIIDAIGCKASTVFKVIAWCKELVIPNAFSPNNDGYNDIWRVGGLDSEPHASLQIYNRFGNIVFQTNGSNSQWDGKIKGRDAPVGIYYYVIKSKQSTTPFKGSVTLIR
jgi:gliding motility-associated-like protein